MVRTPSVDPTSLRLVFNLASKTDKIVYNILDITNQFAYNKIYFFLLVTILDMYYFHH